MSNKRKDKLRKQFRNKSKIISEGILLVNGSAAIISRKVDVAEFHSYTGVFYEIFKEESEEYLKEELLKYSNLKTVVD